MYRNICLILLLLCSWSGSRAQIVWPSPEVAQMYQHARGLMTAGSLNQAIVAYQQIVPLAPGVMEVYRDLGRLYYLTGAYDEANKTLSSVIAADAADRETYQIAAASWAAQKEYKKARSVLEQGISRFPEAGILYHELGRQYDDRNEPEQALAAWLNGIQADPSYYVNYYEAARSYMAAGRVIWAILYAETFLTREHQTPRAQETRKMLLAAYKRLYRTPRLNAAPQYGKGAGTVPPKSFEEAVEQTFLKLAPIVSDGFSTENLIMLRTRFIIAWTQTYARQYPFSLFSWHERLLQEGYFDAYNQWLLGKVENAQVYDAWNSFHKGAVERMLAWTEQYPYRPVTGEFYNDKKVKGLFSGRKN
jgi:tetratricopeptide (TPR) repeat protein